MPSEENVNYFFGGIIEIVFFRKKTQLGDNKPMGMMQKKQSTQFFQCNQKDHA